MDNAVTRVSASSKDFPLNNDDRHDHQQSGVHPSCILDLAHELRQPLSTIESLAYYLEITTDDDEVCHHLKQIRSMVGRASRILEHASVA